jgi:hypothetical protein
MTSSMPFTRDAVVAWRERRRGGAARAVMAAGAVSALIALGAAPAGALPRYPWWAPAATRNGLVGFGQAPTLAGPVSAAPWVAMAPTPSGRGAWLVGAAGNVVNIGDAAALGRTDQIPLRAPVVGLVAARHGAGYWIVGADGAVFSFGRAMYHGSVPVLSPGDKVVGLAATPDAGGYWLATSSGKVIAYGDALALATAVVRPPTAPVVAIASTSTGKGYSIVSADGHVLASGDAVNHGSATALPHGDRVVGMAATTNDGGYWLATVGGSVLPFGNAPAIGSLAGWTHSPVVGITPDIAGNGFWLMTASSPPGAGAQNSAAGGGYMGGVWACIRQRESGGSYGTNTGNGYYGAYQFSLPTWQSVGGSGLPSQASPAEQDRRAQLLRQRAGWGQWSTAGACGV